MLCVWMNGTQLSSALLAAALNCTVNQVMSWTPFFIKALISTKAFHERSPQPGDKR